MTKKILILIVLLSVFLQFAYSLSLSERIQSLPDVISVEKMEQNPFFEEAWVIMVRQPLDHRHPELGTFPQRVILSHLGYDKPVIMVTEGYAADNEIGPKYLNELCPLLYANLLFIEHRYFGKSVPDSMDWKYLTVENAAADHHHINEIFKQIYPSKWIATGISKGGQATLFYRMLYPTDVALTVAYVAPLNFAVEDRRHSRFILHKAGSAAERRAVMAFQKEILRRKASLLPLFENYCTEQKYRFNAPVSEIYDYCVLEFSFSFWQWCHPVGEIPPHGSSDKAIFEYFTKTVSPDYFDLISGKSVLPFFVQALRELGYYAYNPKPFRRLMQVKDTKGYVARLFVPAEARFPYEPKISLRLDRFIKKEAKNILLIYGANDPWSASAANTGSNHKILKIIQPAGCHLARISTLPDQQHDLAVDAINDWLRKN